LQSVEKLEIQTKIRVTKSSISLYDGKFCETHWNFEGIGFHEKRIPDPL